MLIVSFFLFSFLFFFDFFFLFLTLVVGLFLLYFSHGGGLDGGFIHDDIRVILVFLSLFIFVFSMLSMDLGLLGNFLFWLMLVLILSRFLLDHYLGFYIIFEIVFVIMFYFLLNWGKRAERFHASFYILFYTLIFSLPFLVYIISAKFSYSRNFSCLFSFSFSGWFWVFVLFLFSVKLPLFGLHLWLPKAHVEAPVSGSMLLAGVLLKLGGYGLARFLPLLGAVVSFYSFLVSFLFYLGLFSIFYVSLICLRQIDLKIIIAYSSVVHIGVVFLGLFRWNLLGLGGSILIMVAHGFVSSFLFYGITECYILKHSRRVIVLKGIISFSPIFCLFWFLGCFLNLRVPPFIGFFSEILVIRRISFLSFLDWFFLGIGLLVVGFYCVFMYLRLGHGYSSLNFRSPFSLKFFLLGFSHFFFAIVFPLLMFF